MSVVFRKKILYGTLFTLENMMNFDEKTKGTLFQYLDPLHQDFIRKISEAYPLTHQELKEICEIARDLQQWGERSLLSWWSVEEKRREHQDRRAEKKRIIQKLRSWVSELRNEPKKYFAGKENPPHSHRFELEECDSDKKIFGTCPVFSDDTVCCNLRTIDAVENCGYGCSYCTIQDFYGENVTFQKNLREKLSSIPLDSGRFYHLGTGQSSDSLMWGNHNGLLEDLCHFARERPNVLLEFKTKSANISYFLKNEIPPNVVLSWTLNTDMIIQNEEHFTPTLSDRISAARKVADRGVKVAFHFHPMVYYEGWKKEYLAIVKKLLRRFFPEEILFISFGSVTLIKPLIKGIRKKNLKTKILKMPMVSDPKGKLTYPDDVKVEMFKTLHQAFQPWHEKVYFYLCMEKADIWRSTFGYVYPNNEAFESDFLRKAMSKVPPFLGTREEGN